MDGHRVEFFHHFYEAARNKRQENYVFAYPETDEDRMKSVEWIPSSNIVFYKHKLEYNTQNKYKRSYQAYKVLKKTIRELNPSDVYLMDIFQFMPYIAMIKSTRISGLIGGIYLYTWKKDSIRKHLEDILKYQLYARLPVFKYLYIQSDACATKYLNKKYHTDKFKYICDPFPELSTSVKDLRDELNINKDKTIVLHPGFMSSRKGTINLLAGILACKDDVLSQFCFVFAGSVDDPIKEQFDSMLSRIKKRGVSVIFIGGYVSFDYLSSLIFTCDLIFIPYLQTNQSSGIVGYGAKYNKPVVVIKSGLLSKIVRDYKLGYIIPDASVKSISDFLEGPHKWEPKDSGYLAANTVSNFSETVINDFVAQ